MTIYYNLVKLDMVLTFLGIINDDKFHVRYGILFQSHTKHNNNNTKTNTNTNNNN